jgi:hypothetical protein
MGRGFERRACFAAAAVLTLACGRSELDVGRRKQVVSGGSAGAGQGGAGQGGAGQGGTAAGGFGPGSGGFGPGSGGFGPGSGGFGPGSGGFGPGAGGAGGCKPESCLNGMDDDCDGLVDCADPNCFAGFTCTPDAPADWQGPVALYQGPGDSAAPSCGMSGGYPLFEADGFDGLSAAPAMCPGCGCSDPKGVACDIAQEQFFGNNQCAGGGGTLTIAANVCQAFVSLSDPLGVAWSAAPPSGGVCLTKTMGTPVVPPVGWANRARACDGEPDGGGCGPNLCVPRPAGNFQKTLCIVHGGDVPCPGGAYGKRSLYYQGVADSRGCTDCECGPPKGMTCTGTLQLWDDTQCQSNTTTLTSVGQCGALMPDPTPPPAPYKTLRSTKYTPGAAIGGSCTSTPSVATGEVKPAAPITICCTN